jgi:hypothetical protein
MKTIIIILISLILITCDDATIASHNLSEASDNFEVNRRVIFYNGITDTYILTIQGKCSIEKDNHDKQLEVICKTGPGAYKKHFLGISDNVTYFVEQMGDTEASANHYRVVFKPQSIIPDVDFKGSTSDIPRNQR